MNPKFWWGLAALLSLLLAAQHLQAGVDKNIDVRQAQTMNRQGALLLDVREAEEFAAIHAPHAALLPLSELSTRLKEIEAYKNKPIAVMCRSGRRSARAAALLQEAGFTQVSNVEGGIQAWEQAGLEVIRR